jgi:hypothetical protein
MIPDWILSLQASATCARRLNMSKKFHWDEDTVCELQLAACLLFHWDEDTVCELQLAACLLETLLSEQEGIYNECMENTKLN